MTDEDTDAGGSKRVKQALKVAGVRAGEAGAVAVVLYYTLAADVRIISDAVVRSVAVQEQQSAELFDLRAAHNTHVETDAHREAAVWIKDLYDELDRMENRRRLLERQ